MDDGSDGRRADELGRGCDDGDSVGSSELVVGGPLVAETVEGRRTSFPPGLGREKLPEESGPLPDPWTAEGEMSVDACAPIAREVLC